MPHLKDRDLNRLHESIAELYSCTQTEALAAHVVEITAGLMPASVVSYARIGRRRGRLDYQGIASHRKWDALDAFVQHMHEHPVLNFLHADLLPAHRYGKQIEEALQRRMPWLRQSPCYSAARISDALANDEFRSLGLYHEFFRRNEAQYQLLTAFLPEHDGYSMLSFSRDRRDFSEDECLMAALLGPHIEQAYRNARLAQDARQALVQVERSSPVAQAHALTPREEEVLYWVAQGKTNSETAQILGISAGTVKIHLERTFQKLGVENRTGAAAMFMRNTRTARKD